jgi:predicted amidohydrolase YtcJ
VHGAYAWKDLIREGSYVPGGSDFPVERPDPLPGIYAAAFRQDAHGKPASADDIATAFSIDESVPNISERWKNGWYAEQAMSREESVRAFTSWAAAAAGLEGTMGSLEPGKWADFVVLSGDIMTAPRERFLQIGVLATYLGGNKVFDGK